MKTSIRVSDLNDVFGWTAREAHVLAIRETATPFSEEQAAASRKVFLDHIREREAMRRRPGKPGSLV